MIGLVPAGERNFSTWSICYEHSNHVVRTLRCMSLLRPGDRVWLVLILVAVIKLVLPSETDSSSAGEQLDEG